MTKIGVLGAGHLGKIHLKCIKNIADYQLVGFFDPDKDNATKIAAEMGIKAFDSAEALVKAADVVDVVSPTTLHYQHAALAVKNFKHVFIEKPITAKLDEARELVSLVREAGVKAMVGHVERFNPAFLALKGITLNPMFIEVHRLAQWNPRGTDVSVVLDVMIHDLDIIHALVKSTVKRISANGVAIVGDTSDIAQARIEFHNGCVVNVTASRISQHNMRRCRIYQSDAYITVDFLNKKTEVYTVHDKLPEGLPKDQPTFHFKSYTKEKHMTIKSLPVQPVNAIQMELEELLRAIKTDTEPAISAYDGFTALQTAYAIEERIAGHNAQG
jgi:predicted dehydrogenase